MKIISRPHGTLRISTLLAGFMMAIPLLQAGDAEDLKKQVDELSKSVKSLQNQVQTQKQVMEDHGISTTKQDFTKAPEWKAMQQDVREALTAATQKKPNMFNPSISLALDSITSYSRNTGVDFIPRDIELNISATVDQFARAYAVFNAATALELNDRVYPFRRAEGQNLGVEEAAIETLSLPGGLALKAGQFFADFSRMGKVHPHDRPFTDGPRSLDTIIGGETQARGGEMSWVTPLDHYFRLTGGIVDGIGAEPFSSSGLVLPDGSTRQAFPSTADRGFGDLTYYLRGVTMFELSPTANLSLGADYARNFQSERRQLASADFKVEWKPKAASHDLFTWSGETIWSRIEGNIPYDSAFGPAQAASLVSGVPVPFSTTAMANSIGGYSYVQYRFGKKLEPGLRFDVTMPQNFEFRDNDGDGNAFDLAKVQSRFFTYSGYVTYYLSDFNRLRLQAQYVDAQNDPSAGGGNLAVGPNKSDWQIFLQWTVMLGDHKHAFSP